MTEVTGVQCRLLGRPGASNRRGSAIAAALALSVTGGTASAAPALDRAPYGTTQAGQAVEIFTMTNDHGLHVRFLSLGGVITEIDVPDRAGRLDNVVLGLNNLREYETFPGHFGAITGRYANRIGGAQFTLNGQAYHLIANNGPNTLHGGPNALDRQVWTVTPLTVPDGVAATLSYVSPDGDQNFPGTLDDARHLHADQRRRAADRLRRSAPTRIPWSTSPTTPISTWPATGPARLRVSCCW